MKGVILDSYFADIEKKLKEVYEVANAARAKGLDPKPKVEIPAARSMAERVEGLISAIAPQIVGQGMPQRIEELEKKYGSLDWRISLIIAEEIAKEKFCKFESKKEAMEIGIRVGFAYHTLGTVASPLEGFIGLDIRKRKDGKEYFALLYAGPIRSAGGTGASVSVLISDYIRRVFGYDVYDPQPVEIKRAVTEVVDYHERVTNLQYYPSKQEIAFMAEKLPVQIDGPETSKVQVSNHRDVERIESNFIRGGFCLVMAECLCQKAPKVFKNISKWGKEFSLDQWNFLEQFIKIQKKAKAASKGESTKEQRITPDFTYIKDIVAGRPVLSHPMENGGFRLRYGRGRLSGYSCVSINPSMMVTLNGMLGIGTQLKMERPGKGATVTPCSVIDGPIVRLKDGTVVKVNTVEYAKTIRSKIEEILYLGDILISYGDFFNRAHPLVPAGYCEEWWVLEFEKSIVDMFGALDLEKVAEYTGIDVEIIKDILKNPFEEISSPLAFSLSSSFGIPLHPLYTYFWETLSLDEFKQLINWLKGARVIAEQGNPKKLILNNVEKEKRFLELIGLPHQVVNKEFVVIGSQDSQTLAKLGIKNEVPPDAKDPLDALFKMSGIKLRPKGGMFIGARMGRPEKGKIRKMKGSPHGLFPVGEEGGRMRSLQGALQMQKVTSDFPIYHCNKCKKETIYPKCEVCGSKTEKWVYCRKCAKALPKCDLHKDFCSSYKEIELDIRAHLSSVLKSLKMRTFPDLIKGVRGTSNRGHVPEHLAKGVLRAKNNIQVNKDGTVRFDMTQLPITHFKPKEIGTPIDVLIKLGYETDMGGNKLTNENQILELKPQDIILPNCVGAPEEGANKIFVRVAQFIDELLVKHYHLKPYYNVKTSSDLIGVLTVVLAPHTSAGIVSRIIGFSDTQCLFAHPMLHAATRRDCDGDEACAMLLLDTLINFSRDYLPAHRGATQDAPLVITSMIKPSEIDDMVLDMDIAPRYTLEFYEAALEYKTPYEIKVDQVVNYIKTDTPCSGFSFTHDTENMNAGVLVSTYKTLPTMAEKLLNQMQLAKSIRAVDTTDVARLVIEKHFIRDIKGNLRKFSMQQFRCVDCNKKFRRPPLVGNCDDCGGTLIFTISKGSIVKYLEPALELARKFEVAPYLMQSLELTKARIEEYFGKEKEKQSGLAEFV